jgi:hypothetical protein
MGEEKVSEGLVKLIATMLGIRPRKERVVMQDDQYEEFLKNTSPDASELYYQRDESIGVMFSVIYVLQGKIDVGSVIGSLNEQTCKDWELCIAADPEPEADMGPLMKHPRVRLCVLPDTEEEELINAAVGMARGDYLLFLEAGDVLTKDALYRFEEEIAERPEADFFYADEDIISEEGKRVCPVFKPEFSTETLLGYNFIGAHSLSARCCIRSRAGLREWTARRYMIMYFAARRNAKPPSMSQGSFYPEGSYPRP